MKSDKRKEDLANKVIDSHLNKILKNFFDKPLKDKERKSN